MRAKRSGVRGCASGSASAAAWRSASVMASKRLQSCLVGSAVFFMVLSSFMGLCSSGRNDADRFAWHRVGDVEQATLGHADYGVTVFAIILALVEPIEGERVCERLAGCLECHAVVGDIRCGLGVIPLEFTVIHNIRLSRSFVKGQASSFASIFCIMQPSEKTGAGTLSADEGLNMALPRQVESQIKEFYAAEKGTVG